MCMFYTNNSKVYSRIKMISNGVKIVILLFLLMTTLSMMSGNVWGEEIYTHTDKDGTLVVTNIPPEETTINFNTRQSNSYQDSNSEERLHWGRDNALTDEEDERNKGKNRKRKAVKDGRGIESGVYRLTIKKIASNLYQDIFTRMIIKTNACFELEDINKPFLNWYDVQEKVIIKKKTNITRFREM